MVSWDAVGFAGRGVRFLVVVRLVKAGFCMADCIVDSIWFRWDWRRWDGAKIP